MYGKRKRYSYKYRPKTRRYSKYTRKRTRIIRRKRGIRRTLRRGGPILHVRRAYIDTIDLPNNPSFTIAQHMNFKLSDVSGSLTNEIGLYSHYKIKKVVVKFLPRFQLVQENAAIIDGEEFGFWGYAPDYNGTLPDYNSIAEVYADSMGKVRRGWKGFKAVIKPMVRVPTYTGAITIDYMNVKGGWMETYDDDTVYNGLRWIWNGSISAGKTVTFDMHVIYYIGFKGLRKPN